MDWQNVTADDLRQALIEVDWRAPRPLAEFFAKFSPPKSTSKWTSRLKCNVYYYRTNYLVIAALSFVACFVRNPLALVAVALSMAALLALNDPFANTLNDLAVKLVRKVNARAAQRMRAAAGGQQGPIVGSRRAKGRVLIAGAPREAVVAGLALKGLVLFYISRGILTLAWAGLLGLGLPLLHATFRSPNLKARLASAREEFRAVWRGYQAETGGHDYTL